MDESQKPLRLFINPFSLWTDLALKTGEAMLATAHAAALRANGTLARVDVPKVAVLPAATVPSAKVAVIPTADAPQPRAKPASKVVRFKAARAKLRSKASAKT